MPIRQEIGAATNILAPSTGFLKYAIWLLPLVAIVVAISIGLLIKKYNAKKFQWTHTLRIRRSLPDGVTLSDEESVIKMRRFSVLNGADVFELEKAVLGIYLFPELDKYSGKNQFSIILDSNNRIYTPEVTTWTKTPGSINVSAKHSEIDLARKTLKEDFQNINKVSKRIEWAEIAKWAVIFTALVVFMVLGIVGLTKWGDSQEAKAKVAQADVLMSENMVKVMETMAATVNTQKMQITPMLEKLYGTSNLQSVINDDTLVS